MKKTLEKVKNYIKNIEYGKVVISIHQGKIQYIEKVKKEKINNT